MCRERRDHVDRSQQLGDGRLDDRQHCFPIYLHVDDCERMPPIRGARALVFHARLEIPVCPEAARPRPPGRELQDEVCCPEVQDVTDGKSAGNTWLEPLRAQERPVHAPTIDHLEPGACAAHDGVHSREERIRELERAFVRPSDCRLAFVGERDLCRRSLPVDHEQGVFQPSADFRTAVQCGSVPLSRALPPRSRFYGTGRNAQRAAVVRSAVGPSYSGYPPRACPGALIAYDAALPNSADNSVIELIGLSRYYDMGGETIRALEDVSFAIRSGELVAIIGSSGSGKSTLMNLLGCLDVPSKGTYRLRGSDVATLDDDALSALRNREIGFVFQNFQLLPRASALANVALPLVYRGLGARERTSLARSALERVGLGQRLDHRPNQLSGGQRQRVAIARALVTGPALLLADEPTGNLDSATGREILDLFDELHRGGSTIVIVTHEPTIAARCPRAIRLSDGHVVEDTGVRPRALGAA